MKSCAGDLGFWQLVASVARSRLVTVGWLAFVRMPLPDLRIGCVTTPTRLPRRFIADAGMFGARGHRGWLTTYDPEEGKQGDYANSNRQKINVFSIHKSRAEVGSAGESP